MRRAEVDRAAEYRADRRPLDHLRERVPGGQMLAVFGHVVSHHRQLPGGQHAVDQRIAPGGLDDARGGAAPDHQRRQERRIAAGCLERARRQPGRHPAESRAARQHGVAGGALLRLLLLSEGMNSLDRVGHAGEEILVLRPVGADLFDDQPLLDRAVGEPLPAERHQRAALRLGRQPRGRADASDPGFAGGVDIAEIDRVLRSRQPERVEDRGVGLAELRLAVQRGRARGAGPSRAEQLAPPRRRRETVRPRGLNAAELGPLLDDVGERPAEDRCRRNLHRRARLVLARYRGMERSVWIGRHQCLE
jgi:hypothetical protein